MEEELQELGRLMAAQVQDHYDKVFIIDVADIPHNMTAEEFAEHWQEHQDKGELIYISRDNK